MKTAILCLLMLLSNVAIAQDNRSIASGNASNSIELDKLQKAVARIENEIQNKSDSLAILREKIKHIENQEYLTEFNLLAREFSCFTTLRMPGDIQEASTTWAATITYLNEGDTIQITDYNDGYWKASKGQIFGYIHDILLTQTEEVKVLKAELERQNADLLEKEKAEKLEQYNALNLRKRKDYEKSIILTYGDEIGKKLLGGDYWIGMTKEMARISLGNPNEINRTVGSWGVHEQWVYSSLYLYFEDGKLTSYQN